MEENYSLEKIIGQAIAASENEIRTEKIRDEEYEDDWIDFGLERGEKGERFRGKMENVERENWKEKGREVG